MKSIIVGIVLFMVALWGGSYLLYIIPSSSWLFIPSLVTTALLAVAGYALASEGFYNLD
jgi:hypothetical protein